MRRFWWGFVRTSIFLVLTFFLAYGDPRAITHRIVGNPGDAFLIYSLLVWGGSRLTHLLSGYSAGPMFAGGSDAMAYSDTFLPLTIPFRVMEAFGLSPTTAFNVLYLSSWVLACEFAYRLAIRCCTSRPAAVVGAVAFSFTTLRLGQAGHFQLAWGALIPLALLAVLRLRRDPTLVNGVLVALVVVAQFLVSAYYGLILLVGVGGLVVVFAALRWRATRRFADLGGYVVTIVSLGLLMGPITWWYRSAEESYVARSVYPGYFRLRLGDLRAPAPTADLPRRFGVLDADSALRSSENFAYVGVFVAVFVPLFLILLAIRRRNELFSDRQQVVALAAVAFVGLVATSIAVGHGPVFGLSMPFYEVARALIPGVGSMVAIVRLFVFMQLALVLVATVALGWLLRLMPDRRLRVIVAGLALMVVVADSHLDLDHVEVPDVADGSVYSAMRELDGGKAVELPIAPLDYPGRPYLESTRMLLGAQDEIQIVNGHSGHWPVGYESTVETLNRFPEPEAIDMLQQLGVNYVVLHGAPIETGMDAVTDWLNTGGFAYFEPAELDRIMSSLPPGAVRRTIVADDGIVLVLD